MWCKPHDSKYGPPGYELIAGEEFETEEDAQKRIDEICEGPGGACKVSDWDD